MARSRRKNLATSRLPRNISTVLCGGDPKSELRGLFAQPEFSTSSGLLVAPFKDALVVRFFGAEQVVNNSSQFVSGGGDCLGLAEFPSDAPKELAWQHFAAAVVTEGWNCGKGAMPTRKKRNMSHQPSGNLRMNTSGTSHYFQSPIVDHVTFVSGLAATRRT